MSSTDQISPLRIANEAFMVASTIERCPRQMMLRELVMNAMEAASQATDAGKLVRIDAVPIGEAPKLRIWNTGRGLSPDELLQISDISSSLFKTVSLDGNFGMGAKAASLASNKLGLRYRSCRRGKVSQILLGARDGVYGRLLQGDGREVIDVTAACADAGEPLSHDWTDVTLFGNAPEQNTAADPFGGDPALGPDWIVQTLARRFVRLPAGVELALETSATGAPREIFTPTLTPASFDRMEAVAIGDGVVIHYGYRAKDSALPPSRVNALGLGAIVYHHEVYALIEDRRWALEAPTYGFPFSARQCSVIVELPQGYAVRPEQYRQFLRFAEGDQRQAQFGDFGAQVRAHMPEWLKRIISSQLPAETDYLNEIRDEMRHLLTELGLEDLLRPAPPERKDAAAPPPPEPQALKGEAEPGPPPPPPKRPDPVTPEIITIDDEAEIVEKALGGRAARYYASTRQVFVNARYSAIVRMKAQLAEEFAPFADDATIEGLAKRTAEWAVVQRIARTLIHSLGKPKSGWSADEVQAVQAPETMSLLVDDIEPLLTPARRRMASQLGIEAPSEGGVGIAADPAAQRAAAELADAEAMLQRAMSANAPRLGWLYRQIAAIHTRRRDSATARAWLEKGMAVDPEDAWCRHEYAGLLASAGEHDRAAQFSDEALALAKEPALWLKLRRAEIERLRGEPRKAEAMLRAAAEEDPQTPWPHTQLVDMLLNEGRVDDAADAADVAIARDPQAFRPLHKRGDVELRRGDAASAARYYERAAALEPNDPWVRVSMARLHAKEGRFDEAAQALDAALAAGPEQPAPVHRTRSEIEMQRGDRKAALVAAQRAVKADPADMWNHFHLSGVLGAIGDLDGAAEAAKQAELSAPSPFSPIFRRLAEIEGRRNNPAAALQHLERGLAADPRDAEIWLAIANHRAALNDLDGADAAAATAQSLLTGAALAPALRTRSQFAARRGDPQRAKQLILEAVAADPGDGWSRLALADQLFAGGDVAAAVESIEQTIALFPTPNSHVFGRAAAFEAHRKNWDAARAYLDRALAAEPDNPHVKALEAQLLASAGHLDAAAAAAESALKVATREREAALAD